MPDEAEIISRREWPEGYQITVRYPDGATYKLTFPKGLDSEDIAHYIRMHHHDHVSKKLGKKHHDNIPKKVRLHDRD